MRRLPAAIRKFFGIGVEATLDRALKEHCAASAELQHRAQDLETTVVGLRSERARTQQLRNLKRGHV